MGKIPFLGTAHRILSAGFRAAEAAISGNALNKELREGRVEVVKLFEQGLPRTARERFALLEQKAAAFCAHKDIDVHELPTFLPAILELRETFFATEDAYNGQNARLPASAPALNQALKSPDKSRTLSASLPPPASAIAVSSDVPSPVLSKVRVVANQHHGTLYTRWPEAPEHGYITLEEDDPEAPDFYYPSATRRIRLRQRCVLLESFIDAFHVDGRIPGRILIREFRESVVPLRYYVYFDPRWGWDRMIAPFIKRLKPDGPELTINGERILRFTDYLGYVSPGDSGDIIIQHDNQKEIAQWLLSSQTAAKPMPLEVPSSPVFIVKQASTGDLQTDFIISHANMHGEGEVELRQEWTVVSDGSTYYRTCSYETTINNLLSFLKAHVNLVVPGNIQALECWKDAIPHDIRARFFDPDIDEEDVPAGFEKLDSETGESIFVGDSPLLRFMVYDPQGTEADRLILLDEQTVKQKERGARLKNRGIDKMITVVANKTTGNFYTPYQARPDFGFVHLQHVSMEAKGGWLREIKKTALVRSRIKDLIMFLVTYTNGERVAGTISVEEYVESKIPAPIANRCINHSQHLDYEERIRPYLKKDSNGQCLTLKGERILRFTDFDPAGNGVYIKVVHDGLEKSANHFEQTESTVVGSLPAEIIPTLEPAVVANTLNLASVEVQAELRVKSLNPYFILFKTAHEVVRTSIGLFFVILVRSIYQQPNLETLQWLKAILYSLDLHEETVLSISDTVITLHESGEDCTRNFSPIAHLNREPTVLFVWLYFVLTKQAMHEGGGESRGASAKALMLLPESVREEILSCKSLAGLGNQVLVILGKA